MRWMVVYKAQYIGGYLITEMLADTIEEVVEKMRGRKIISITCMNVE